MICCRRGPIIVAISFVVGHPWDLRVQLHHVSLVIFSSPPAVSVCSRGGDINDCHGDAALLNPHDDRIDPADSALYKRAIFGSEYLTLRVWDLENKSCRRIFTCDSEVRSCSWQGTLVLVRDVNNQIPLLHWME